MKNHFLLLQLNIIWRFNYYSINGLRFLRDKILVSVYDLCLCYGHNLKRHSFFILWLLFRLKLLVCAKRAANFSDALIQAFSVENEVVKSSLLGFRERFGEAFDWWHVTNGRTMGTNRVVVHSFDSFRYVAEEMGRKDNSKSTFKICS